MSNETEMKQDNLGKQIMRFAVVGGLSFVIDFAITNTVALALRTIGMNATAAAMVGALFGFIISVIFNYILSMHWVFDRNESMDKRKEFIIFVTLSVIGLGLSSLTRRRWVRLSPIAQYSPLLPPVGVWTVSQFQCGGPSSQNPYRSSPRWAVTPPSS